MPSKKSPPKCSLCKLPGHTKKNCPTLTNSSDEKSPDFNPKTTLKKIQKEEKKISEEKINNPVKSAEEKLAEKKKLLLAQMEELEKEEKVLEDKKNEELKKQHALRVEKYNEEYNANMLTFFKDNFNTDLTKTKNNLAYETYKHFVKHSPPVMGQEKSAPGPKNKKGGGKVKTDFSCKKQKNYNPEKHGIEKLTDVGCNCLRVYSDGNFYNILGWCNKNCGGGVCARHTKNPDEITAEHKNYLLHGDHKYKEQNKQFYDKM